MKELSIAVLAAGKGSRLQLPWPKVLCPILGQTMLDYVLGSLANFTSEKNLDAQVGVVTGYLGQQVINHLAKVPALIPRHIVIQKEQLGTADAVKAYLEQTPQALLVPMTMIVCGDTPLLTEEIFKKMWDRLQAKADLQAVACSFITCDPSGLGRIIRENGKAGFKIVEEKDATAEQKKINEVNAALYLIRTPFLSTFLSKISNKNNAKEFYLTDLFAFGQEVETLCYQEDEYFLGVNDQEQLEVVTKKLQKRKIQQLRSHGVFIPDAGTVSIDWNVKAQSGATIYPGCVLQGYCELGESSHLGPYAVLRDTKVLANAKVHPFTVTEGAVIGDSSEVGPLARLRPGANLAAKVKIGNFVEVKKSDLGKGAKVSHLSYIGDAIIGEDANIGCGFITCNYDGKNKHQTIIGARTFIGSDCQAIAPISIGSDSFVAAGSTLTQDVPSGAFVIARARQSTKIDLAKRFLKPGGSDKV